MKYVLILITSFAIISCTDGHVGKLTNFGNSASITCYSGGIKIFEGRSTGKVSSEENSDGYFFKDAKDGNLKEVSGNCVIEYD